MKPKQPAHNGIKNISGSTKKNKKNDKFFSSSSTRHERLLKSFE